MLCFEHCGFLRHGTQKQPMCFVGSRRRAAEGWTRVLWDVCPVPFRKDDLNGSRSHCELLWASHWPSAALRSEISHPRPAQFTHSKKKHKTVQCQTLLEFNRLSQERLCDKSKELVEGCMCVCFIMYMYFPSALDTKRHLSWICLPLLIRSCAVVWLVIFPTNHILLLWYFFDHCKKKAQWTLMTPQITWLFCY